MSRSGCKTPLAEARNGIVIPLYFDRQVIRAADLNLGHASHAAEVARMRRYLHGWGVVAGLIPRLSNGALEVSPGYGVTMTGEEVLLIRSERIEGIRKGILACCAPARDCGAVTDADLAAAAEEDDAEVESWIVARPVATEAEPRPGVPEGCEHPANLLLPTRACGGVSLELRCELSSTHRPEPARCAELREHICPEEGKRPKPVPMPPKPVPEDNFLVLGKLVATREGVTLSLEGRRPLLPTYILQDWLMACLCPVVAERQPAEEDEEPDDDAGGGRRGGFVEGLDWNRFRHLLHERAFLPDLPPRIGEIPGVLPERRQPGTVDPLGPRILFESPFVETLEAANIDGPGAFLDADTQELATMTGKTEEEIEQLKQELEGLAPILREGGF